MKKDELQKLKEKNQEELLKELQTNKDNLWQLKLDLTAGKVKNVREIRKLKKVIAIIHTKLKEQTINQ